MMEMANGPWQSSIFIHGLPAITLLLFVFFFVGQYIVPSKKMTQQNKTIGRVMVVSWWWWIALAITSLITTSITILIMKFVGERVTPIPAVIGVILFVTILMGVVAFLVAVALECTTSECRLSHALRYVRDLPMPTSRVVWAAITAAVVLMCITRVAWHLGCIVAPNPGYAVAIINMNTIAVTVAATALFGSHLCITSAVGVLIGLVGVMMVGFASNSDA
jgi:hypothetical protein